VEEAGNNEFAPAVKPVPGRALALQLYLILTVMSVLLFPFYGGEN
jgi:hypothetical protein